MHWVEVLCFVALSLLCRECGSIFVEWLPLPYAWRAVLLHSFIPVALSRPCGRPPLLPPHVPAFQNKYKTSVKKKAERQILAVKPSATEEELSAVFEQEVRKFYHSVHHA